MFQLVSLFNFSTCNCSLVLGCTWMDIFGAQMGLHGAQTDTTYASHLKFFKPTILTGTS